MNYPNLFRCGMHEWGGCECDAMCKQSIPQNAFKVVVAGGRDFDDYQLLTSKLDHLFKNRVEIEIVSGCARGADSLGEKYAKKRGIALRKFPADWEIGKHAGHVRNREMAEYCDAVVVFWDGVSRGTANMIKAAEKLNKPVRIIRYDRS